MSNSDTAYKLQEEGRAATPPSLNLKDSKSSPTQQNKSRFLGTSLNTNDLCGGYAVDEWSRDTSQSKYYMPRNKRAMNTEEDDGIETQLSEHDKIVIQRLAMRRCHLPGNNYWEDLCQFLLNNHPILSFWFADPRHPFQRQERIINLVASVSFGLGATSFVMLWYYYEERDMSEVVYTAFDTFDITSGTVSLLTIGGLFHCLFDLSIWYIQACPFCRPGGTLAEYLSDKVQKIWVWIGTHIAAEAAIVSCTLALYVVVLRASVEDDGDDNGISYGFEDYRFVLNFFLELFVTLFIFFPVGTFVLFTGVLGCARIPRLGGRPQETRALKMHRLKQLASQDGIVNVDDGVNRAEI